MLLCSTPLAYAALGGPNTLDARAQTSAGQSASCPATRLAAAGGESAQQLHIWGRLGMVGMVLAQASERALSSGRHSLVHGMRMLVAVQHNAPARALGRFTGAPSIVELEEAVVSTTTIWLEE